VRNQDLVHDIVGVQPEVARLGIEDHRVLTWRKFSQPGDFQFEDESAARSQMTCGIAATGDLLTLGQQIPNGVVDQVNHRVLTRGPSGRHVAGCHENRMVIRLDGELECPATLGEPAMRATTGSTVSGANIPAPGVS
jgi:hypothetical protein